MTISEFVALLLEICPAVYHHEAFQEASEFISGEKVGETYTHADNVRAEDGILIAVGYSHKEGILGRSGKAQTDIQGE